MNGHGVDRNAELLAAPMNPIGWHGDVPVYIIGSLKVLMTVGDDFGDGYKWKHLSVSAEDRVPDYWELLAMRDRFFASDEEVVHVFPPREEHRSLHEYCLHLWSRSERMCPSAMADAVAPPGFSASGIKSSAPPMPILAALLLAGLVGEQR